ncbi:hypothetical protein LZ554_001892 [Drepanopeziza brunnea f. sp. 'monogermtubi']|nr:hypothetical protein LZ554_001892 [Drepanopeziza brunnea f. sp. 'monogermtubi']
MAVTARALSSFMEPAQTRCSCTTIADAPPASDSPGQIPHRSLAQSRVLAYAEDSRSFTVFKKLPVELRRDIWELALPDPQALSLDLQFCKQHSGAPIRGYEGPPALLSACSESRFVTLKHYVRAFSSSDCTHGVYIRPSVDVVEMRIRSDGCTCPGVLYRLPRDIENVSGAFGHLDNIERIIISDPYQYIEDIYKDDWSLLLKHLPALKQIRISMYIGNGWAPLFETITEEDWVGKYRRLLEMDRDDHWDDSDAEPENSPVIKAPALSNAPAVLTISESEIKYMGWSPDSDDGPSPYYRRGGRTESNESGDNEFYFSFREWQDGVEVFLGELSMEDVAACLKDFCRLADDVQMHHLHIFHHLRVEYKEKYLRTVYGIQGPRRFVLYHYEWEPAGEQSLEYESDS